MIVLVTVAFCAGYETKSSKVKNNSDAILAYQNYYEACEEILSSDGNWTNENWKNYMVAKQQVFCVSHAEKPLDWPDVCDQRNKLSDAVKAYSDHHPEFTGTKDDILGFVADFGIAPESLKGWSFSY